MLARRDASNRLATAWGEAALSRDERQRVTELVLRHGAFTGGNHFLAEFAHLEQESGPGSGQALGVFQQALEEHEALVSAVLDGDVERAGTAARAHFALSAEALRLTLTRGLQ